MVAQRAVRPAWVHGAGERGSALAPVPPLQARTQGRGCPAFPNGTRAKPIMSDDHKPHVKDAKPTKPGEGDGAKLASRPMTLGDHLFIWTMVILVGVVFGIGPSFGLIFASRGSLSSYNVDQAQVERRQRTAATLQQVLGQGEQWEKRDAEEYARAYRKAQLAEGRGLMPGAAQREELLQDFYQKKTIRGRDYLSTLRDNKMGSELSTDILRTFLAERFANAALDARLTVAPVVSRSAASNTMTLVMTGFESEEVVLSARTLMEPVTAGVDDAAIRRAYDELQLRDRFIEPAVRVISVAVADPAPFLATQPEPADDAVAAWYQAHLDRFVIPATTPDVDQTPAPDRHRPLDEVKSEVVQALKLEGAQAQALEQIGRLQTEVVDGGLETKDAAAFAAAVAAAQCRLIEEITLPEDAHDDLNLGPELGTLKGRSARSIGLVSGKPGEYISDHQLTSSGAWVVIRLVGRREARQRELSDPAVLAEVQRYVGAKQAYPKLLAEAETLRARAEAAGPGGLRKIFVGDADVAARWQVTVTRNRMNAMNTLAAPEPADEGSARGEARWAASLAVAGNPVVIAATAAEGEVARVRLVQCVGLSAAEPLPATGQGLAVARVRQAFAQGLEIQAMQALEREMTR